MFLVAWNECPRSPAPRGVSVRFFLPTMVFPPHCGGRNEALILVSVTSAGFSHRPTPSRHPTTFFSIRKYHNPQQLLVPSQVPKLIRANCSDQPFKSLYTVWLSLLGVSMCTNSKRYQHHVVDERLWRGCWGLDARERHV